MRYFNRTMASLAVLGTICGTFAVSCGVCWCALHRTTGLERFLLGREDLDDLKSAVAVKMEFALSTGETNDVVFLGGSHCAFGVMPREFTRATGLRSYNLATSGYLGVASCATILRHYLCHHPAPQVVVACYDPEWDLCDEHAVLDIPGWPIQRDFYGAFEPELLCFSVRGCVADIKKGFLRLWAEASNCRGTVDDGVRLRLTENRGWSAAAEVAAEPAKAVSFGHVGAGCKASISRIVALCKARGVTVVLRLGPIPTGSHPSSDSEFNAWLRETDRMGVVVACPLLAEIPPDCTADKYHHLNPRGAEWFTRLLASGILRFMPSRLDAQRNAPASAVHKADH